MLKFEFDEEKRNFFLSFWKIKKVSDFSKITADSNLFFLRLCQLNDITLNVLGKIIETKTKEGKDIPKYPPHPLHIPSPPTDMSNQEDDLSPEVIGEIMEMLDSIHLINLWDSSKKTPTHALSREMGDFSTFYHCQLTPEFETCFYTLAHAPFSLKNKKKKEREALNREEKKILSRFIEFYGFTNNRIHLHHPEEAILGLKDKGYIDFFFLWESWIPAAIINPEIFPEQKKTPEPLASPFPKENLAESLFFLQVLKYEQASMQSLPKYYPTSQEKRNYLENIFPQLPWQSSKSINSYSDLSFLKRLLFLIKKFTPNGYRLLRILSENDPESTLPPLSSLETGMSVEEITYEANRRIFPNPNGEAYFTRDRVEEIFNHWTLWGFFIKKQKYFYGDSDIGREIQEHFNPSLENKRKGKTPSIIIDSDYTIIVTKEQISIEEIFYLHHFCTLKISPHLIRGQLDPTKSSLAWYFDYDKNQLINFFKERSGESWQKNFQEMLELYFEHTPYFKAEKTIRLTTASKNFFLKLKYFLEEHHFNSQVTTLEEKKTFIFHDPLIFQKVQEAFPDPAPIKFFEKK